MQYGPILAFPVFLASLSWLLELRKKRMSYRMEEAGREDWLGISENQVRRVAAFYLSPGTPSLRRRG